MSETQGLCVFHWFLKLFQALLTGCAVWRSAAVEVRVWKLRRHKSILWAILLYKPIRGLSWLQRLPEDGGRCCSLAAAHKRFSIVRRLVSCQTELSETLQSERREFQRWKQELGNFIYSRVQCLSNSTWFHRSLSLLIHTTFISHHVISMTMEAFVQWLHCFVLLQIMTLGLLFSIC